MTDKQILTKLKEKYLNGKAAFSPGNYTEQDYIDITFSQKADAEIAAKNELCQLSEQLYGWDVHIDVDRYKSTEGGDAPQLTL